MTLEKQKTPHASSTASFTFLTNHSHVLLLIAANPEMRMREMALSVGITERAVQRIIDELSTTGYLVVTKEGRRNHYSIVTQKPLRHPVEGHCTIGELIHFVHGE
jgi:predicted transcriptional regulator